MRQTYGFSHRAVQKNAIFCPAALFPNQINAGVAQLIERFLAKEEARSLSLLTRTKFILDNDLYKTPSKWAFFALFCVNPNRTQTRTM